MKLLDITSRKGAATILPESLVITPDILEDSDSMVMLCPHLSVSLGLTLNLSLTSG
jgi:hypothetical protein